MKRFFWFVTIVIVIGLGGWLSFRYFTSPLDPNSSQTLTIVIKPGSNVTSIANLLVDKGLIRSSAIFKLVVRYYHYDDKLQAGLFHLSPSQSLKEIIFSLMHGQDDRWLTIPEGFRREQIAELLSKNFSLSQSQFLELSKQKEGYLFPDTYLIPVNTTSQQVLDLLLANYQKKLQPLQPLIKKSSLTEYQIITLASIVERETLSDQEKPIVAGILLKRLRHNWPLQVDATIQYILGKPGNWWPVPTLADRKINSPYNTYLNLGLPPTPIANPGLASIKAVLQPQDSSYWFYLHDNQGHIHYATTNQEHQLNINRYLK